MLFIEKGQQCTFKIVIVTTSVNGQGMAILVAIFTSGRPQLKMLMLSMKVDLKSLETVFLITICRQIGDKWQSKTLFLAILIRVHQLLRAFSITAYLT